MKHFRTYQFLANSPSSLLLKALQRVTIPKSNSVLLFAISTNASDIEDIVSYLSNLATQSVGCLSAPHNHDLYTATCSVGYLDLKDCVPFRSTIPGRPPIQIGRWMTGNKTSMSRDFSDGWLPDFLKDSALGADTDEPRKISEVLPELDTQDLDSVIYFTDNAPQGLIGALNQLPNIKQFGLVGSSTPFITGLPYTLFYNGMQFSSGAVGVALRNAYKASLVSIQHPRLSPISKPMRIDRVDGNLVHLLDELNPTELLLKATAANAIPLSDKDDPLYLGHLLSSTLSVYRIIAGGNSRGALALEGDATFSNGDLVQFYSLQPLLTKDVPTPPTLSESIRFICSQDYNSSSSYVITPSCDIQTFDDFSIFSENGFLVSETPDITKLPFRCTVPGSVAHIRATRRQ